MVRILLIRRALNAIDKRDEVLVSDWELLEQPVLLKESEGKVDQDILTEKLDVFEHIEIPFLNIVHDLKNIGPLTGIHINYLSQTLLVFFNLILVCFSVFSVQFLQEIVEVSFEPSRGVIYLLGGQIYPGLRVNILLSFAILIHC